MENSVALGIVFSLMQQKRKTARELAEQYEVSTRTIYRYIDTLSASGLPLITYNGKNGGIEIDSNFCIEKHFLTTQELDCVLDALNLKQSISNSREVACVKEKFYTLKNQI